MITIKKLNSFKTLDVARTPNIRLSNSKSIIRGKKVKFETPEQLKILTPNSTISKNKIFINLNIKDKKKSTNSKLVSAKKIIIKLNENKKQVKKSKSRYNITPLNKTPKTEDRNYIKYLQSYPKTFYQKIYNSLEKMKLKADKTIEIMKKNLSLTNREILFQKKNILNINTFINRGIKLKKNKLKFFFQEQENSTTNNNIDKAQSEEKNITKNSDIKSLSISNDKNKEKSIENQNSYNNFYNKKYYLGLQKIPLRPFFSIRAKPFYDPLYKSLETNKNFYKNMCHIRFGNMRNVNTSEVSKKIYDAPFLLNIINSFIKEPDLQLKNILNKLRLLLNNVQCFYNNYLIKKEFRHAFANMENHVKAQLNSIIEEECILIIKLVPLILKEFYFSLSQLLFINLPNINEEMEKTPTNEIECLKYNKDFFYKIKEYLTGSIEIYRIIQKQIAEFRFTPNEFNTINNIIDLARYNSTSMISMSNSYIEKTKDDDNIFNNFKIGVKMKKKKKYEKENDLDRFHKRRKIKIINDKDKIERIKSALNIGNKENNVKFNINLRKNLDKDSQAPSILNSFLIKDMMKYFIPEIKEQIISQQVIERYKKIDLDRLKYDPDNWRIDDGSGDVNLEEMEGEKKKKEREKEKERHGLK